MNFEKEELWRCPAVHPLTTDIVRKLSDSLKLGCTEEEIDAFTAQYKDTLKSYQRVHEMVEPTLPVKYPRTPGYRPPPEENTYNAWYYKCNIKGAASGKLAGKRVGIKDNTAVAGVPMMNGSKILEGYVPEFDATVVTRILDAGGEIVGKTSCDELCCGAAGFTNSYGPVLNPACWERSAAGSSAGSAVLVALGELDLATGGDQGGSIRLPASWCGIVGMKPTYGLVPYTGSMAVDMTLDHCGPMARNVYDCALMLEVIAGYDEGRDPRQPVSLTVPEYTKMLIKDLTGKRVALVKEGFDISEPDVKEIVKSAALRLTEAGAIVEEVSVPAHKDGHTVGWKGQYLLSLLDKLSQGYATRSMDLGERVRMKMMFGEYMVTSYRGRFYAKAQNLGRYLTSEYDKVLANYDVIVMPTIPYKAPKLPKANSVVAERFSSEFSPITNTCPFNITGHPSISINVGQSQGLPVGMMITGRHFDDVTVLQVAYAFENLRAQEAV